MKYESIPNMGAYHKTRGQWWQRIRCMCVVSKNRQLKDVGIQGQFLHDGQ